MRFIDELNPAQKEAALFGKGPLLVIAGAGSGKTKTLVYRVARLVEDNVPPERILLLTFTRKAATEMLNRASRTLDSRCQRIAGGTFHSFGVSLLRKYAERLGYGPQFTILDRSDAEDVIQSIRKEKGFSATDKRFPKKSTLLSIFSKSINTGRSLDSIIMSDTPQFYMVKSEIEAIATQYQKQKQELKVMDYDDLLIKVLELLKNHPDVRNTLQNSYDYILVDEYQDTNTIQADIILRLVNKEKNIMVVGDDSQSIYSFRGANFKNILQFPKLFEGSKIIKLEQNYRSTQPILNLTNAIIKHAREKYDKSLFTENIQGPKPTFIETRDDNSQSKFICKKILELREKGTPLSDIAVLMRSGWHSNDIEIELQAHHIPFIKYGGFKFVEASHIKDILCYFKVIFNPSDCIAWNRLLILIEGLGAKTAAQLSQRILDSIKENKTIDISDLKKKKYFNDIDQLFRFIFRQEDTTPSVLIKKILTFYRPLFTVRYDDYKKRESDLESLETISKRFEDLETFLTQISLDPPESSQLDTYATAKDKESITLSTIHSAKGLEWDSVFLLSAIDGYLPSFQSLDDPGQVEEERRLMYVALTRAKQNLFILKPDLSNSGANYFRFGGIELSSPSRFLGDNDLIKDFTETQKSGFDEVESYQHTRYASPSYKKGKPSASSSQQTLKNKYNYSGYGQSAEQSQKSNNDSSVKRKYYF